MSKTLKFKDKYLGQLVDVEPGWGWPGECVSLVQRFIIEEIGAKAKARGDGKAWRTALINEGLGKRVERKDIRIGDIIAWDGNKGHVAIALGGDAIFEQVGPKGKAKIGSIAYWDSVQPSKGEVTRLNDFVDTETKEDARTANIKKGAKSRSLNSKYNGLAINGAYIGVPLTFELNKVDGKDWVYFPSIQTYVAGTDVDFVGTVKPSPQPTSDIGKTAQLRGTKTKPVLLYSTASAKNAFGNGKWQSNEWGSKNLKIIGESTYRYQVESDRYNPNKVWVNKTAVKVV